MKAALISRKLLARGAETPRTPARGSDYLSAF
jgi:hypothetical protein